jgi:hypothetical protein
MVGPHTWISLTPHTVPQIHRLKWANLCTRQIGAMACKSDDYQIDLPQPRHIRAASGHKLGCRHPESTISGCHLLMPGMGGGASEASAKSKERRRLLSMSVHLLCLRRSRHDEGERRWGWRETHRSGERDRGRWVSEWVCVRETWTKRRWQQHIF